MNEKLGSLSAKYESNGDPSSVSGGEGDAGGISYGAYQFASNCGVPKKFVEWAVNYPDETLASYGHTLSQYEVNSQEFIDAWQEIGTADSEGFLRLQHDYTKECYYDSGVTYLAEWYGFDITGRSEALQNVLWSACVQFGAYYGAKNFGEAAEDNGAALVDMADEDIIRGVYDRRLNDMSYSSGSPSLRPGLFSRWENERDDALAMLP